MSAQLITLTVALTGALLAGSVPQATAADARWDMGKDTLKGIKTFSVIVEQMRSTVEEAGLRQAEILADVKVKLRSVGLPVATDEEAKAAHGMPYLYININAIPENQMFTYDVDVSMHQVVWLPPDGDTPRATVADIWNTGMLGRTSAANIRQIVLDKVTQFINDYQEANPKAKT